MHRFHMGDKAHGVVGHRRRHTPENPLRNIRMERLKGDSVRAQLVERGHINAGNLDQIAEQLRSGQSIGFGLSHH